MTAQTTPKSTHLQRHINLKNQGRFRWAVEKMRLGVLISLDSFIQQHFLNLDEKTFVSKSCKSHLFSSLKTRSFRTNPHKERNNLINLDRSLPPRSSDHGVHKRQKPDPHRQSCIAWACHIYVVRSRKRFCFSLQLHRSITGTK